MEKIIYLFLIIFTLSCNSNKHSQQISSNAELTATLESYYNERMELFPMEATYNGDTSYNDLLPSAFTDSYRGQLTIFYQKYKQAFGKFDHVSLNDNDKKSFKRIYNCNDRVRLNPAAPFRVKSEEESCAHEL